jgi:hypothetical protein
MLNTVRAIVTGGQIRLLEELEIPEGTEVLVTPLLDESAFWLGASQTALDKVWNNEEDDVYAELLT